MLAAAVAVAYAPWVPTLVFQASNTAAPWASRPSALQLLGIPGGLFGYLALPLLAVAVVTALRRRPVPEGVPLLALIAVVAAGLACFGSQLEPAWSTRYFAVLLGPLLLALAAVLARGRGWTWRRWPRRRRAGSTSGPAPAKSNVRTVAATVGPELRPGDLVVCTQPEQIPVLYRYLPPGLRYLTPLGHVAQPQVADWLDGVARLRAGRAARVLGPRIRHRSRPAAGCCSSCRSTGPSPSAPWDRTVRSRTREWRAWPRGDPRLRPLGIAPRSTWPKRRSGVRTELFERLPA